MIQVFKKHLTPLLILLLASVPLVSFTPSIVNAADAQSSICQGISTVTTTDATADTDSNGCDASAGSSISDLIKAIIDIFSVIVGAVAVIMIIIGGFRYVVSGGNDSSVSGAKNTIIFALVGLIIVALAQTIVHFVLSKTVS